MAHVGRRQFEQTAVAKLEASGVPTHIARAFVVHGVPKSGRYEQVRDVVCQAKFVKFFVERDAADFDNPHRLGAMVPHVHESKSRKLHTVYAMSEVESLRFITEFPEFEVVARGSEYNSHAFYANKRYAECELLVSYVFSDAHRSGLNPKSLVDLGGNARWHGGRGRNYVLCNNPVLSVRDVMRYKSRDIFASSESARSNNLRFEDDSSAADYGMAVHSTYDLTPRQLASAMLARGISKFYGVLNMTLVSELDAEGTFEVDGMVMTVSKCADGSKDVRYTFSHDASLEYRHKLSTLRAYSRVHTSYQFVDADGGVVNFVYKINSVRGSTAVFSISRESPSYAVSRAVWRPASRNVYYLSIQYLGVKGLKVDAELFDRLVLQAAGARNVETYDIVSLFRYGKSLRQRVSINGIVLSSGFTQQPLDMVNLVIAAYAVAAAYRVESTAYFKEATAQIANLRPKGFLRDIYRIVGKSMMNVLLALPAALAQLTGAGYLDEKIKAMVRSGGSIVVELDRPHLAQGMRFNKHMFTPSGNSVAIRTGNRAEQGMSTPLRTGEVGGALGHFVVTCGFSRVDFRTFGVPNLDPHDMPPVTKSPSFFRNVLEPGAHAVPTEEFRDALYSQYFRSVVGGQGDVLPVVLRNGDRVYRLPLNEFMGLPQLSTPLGAFVPGNQSYFVFRGVGRHAVSLSVPSSYARKGGCLRFVLFFEDSVESGLFPGTAVPYRFDSDSDAATVNEGASRPDGLDSLSAEGDGWVDTTTEEAGRSGSTGGPSVVRPDASEGSDVLMSGANPDAPYTPPHSLAGTLPREGSGFHNAASGSVSQDDSDAVSLNTDRGGPRSEFGDSDAVSSSEVVPGRAAMEELVDLCNRSKDVSVSSARLVVDMAVAVTRGMAAPERWHSMAQGHPGSVVLVKAVDSKFFDFFTGAPLPHMAVSDGETVFDKYVEKPPDGVYVTSEEMRIYVGGSVKSRVESLVSDTFCCPTTVVDGVAGSGKTYTITHEARPGDVVLCETQAALGEVNSGLSGRTDWRGRTATVDSFLIHGHEGGACDTLWIDEAFRLHAGKIFAAMKMVRPGRVVCFGDRKQVQVLPFVPEFDFVHHEFPFDSVVRRTMSYRCPADVCFVLSQPSYYGFHMTTRNPILRSVEGPAQYVSGMFSSKPASVPLLTFTEAAADDLRKEGVKGAKTIGKSQGSDCDEVVVFREKDLNKALYFSWEQTLVALTRHKRRAKLVSAAAAGSADSFLERAAAYLRLSANDVLLASHVASGVKPVANADEFYARAQRTRLESSLGREEEDEGSEKSFDDWSDVNVS